MTGDNNLPEPKSPIPFERGPTAPKYPEAEERLSWKLTSKNLGAKVVNPDMAKVQKNPEMKLRIKSLLVIRRFMAATNPFLAETSSSSSNDYNPRNDSLH